MYLGGEDRVYHVEASQQAPISGWLMSDRALGELYDAVERKLDSERAPLTPGEDPNTPTTAEPAPDEADGKK